MKYDFSSTQIDLPKETAEDIITWGLRNIPDDCIFKQDDKYGRESQIHITVLYGLHTTNFQEVKNIIDFDKFDVTLGQITQFTNNSKYNVVKIDVISKKLHQLHELIKSNLKNSNRFTTYRPHVTIAYVKKEAKLKLEKLDAFSGIVLNVKDIIFSTNEGDRDSISLK